MGGVIQNLRQVHKPLKRPRQRVESKLLMVFHDELLCHYSKIPLFSVFQHRLWKCLQIQLQGALWKPGLCYRRHQNTSQMWQKVTGTNQKWLPVGSVKPSGTAGGPTVVEQVNFHNSWMWVEVARAHWKWLLVMSRMIAKEAGRLSWPPEGWGWPPGELLWPFPPWIPVNTDFGIHWSSWNRSPMNTKGPLYLVLSCSYFPLTI